MPVNYAKLFTTFSEYPKVVEANVRGKIPDWVKGTLLKNGPGIFEVGQDKYNHFFDGLAILQRFHVENGKVFYSSKYLRSETYNRNMASQRIVVGEFGTLAYPDPCKSLFHRYFSYFFPGTFTDNDLVNFIQCGDEIYASSESAILNRIDPKSLDVVQQVDLHKYIATNIATAHPHYDRQGNTYNMGSSYTTYNIILTPNPVHQETGTTTTDGNAMEKSKIVATIPARSSYLSYYHSFGMSENYIVLPEMPLVFNPWKMMTANILRRPLSDGVEWKSNLNTLFHLVGVADSKPLPIKYVTDGFFTFHHANAYEQENCVIVDLVAYKDGSIMQSLDLDKLRKGMLSENENNYGSLWRFILPLSIPPDAKAGDNLLAGKTFSATATAVLKEDGSIHCTHQLLINRLVEFPRINYEKSNGVQYQFCYCAGVNENNKFMLDELCKIDVNTGEALVWSREHEGQFVGEPVFVARPGSTDEDDGVVLSPITDVENEEKNFLLILNAKTFQEIARADVNHIIPSGFHAHFVPQK